MEILIILGFWVIIIKQIFGSRSHSDSSNRINTGTDFCINRIFTVINPVVRLRTPPVINTAGGKSVYGFFALTPPVQKVERQSNFAVLFQAHGRGTPSFARRSGKLLSFV
jgi:hypothetical protein